MTSEYQPNTQKLKIRSLPSSGSWPSALFWPFLQAEFVLLTTARQSSSETDEPFM